MTVRQGAALDEQVLLFLAELDAADHAEADFVHRQAELAEHVVTQLPAPIVQAALVGGPA